MKLVCLLVIYTTSRIFFFFNNRINFESFSYFDFIEGIRFDLSALVYINIPILIALLLPTKLRYNKNYLKLTNSLFYILNVIFIVFNNIDIEYYKFTQKRSTFDFIELILLGSDARNIIPQYLSDYWKITLFTAIQIWFLFKINNKYQFHSGTLKINFFKRILPFLFGTLIFIVLARGGLQLKPIKPINAGEISNSKNTSLILNTPFTILHSLDENKLISYNYFDKSQLDSIYNTTHIFDKKEFKPNIIILIMESYSKEFIGFYNNGNGSTPFLDSLMNHSLVFTNAYSNGLKSIEALPAITASIPSLMDDPFITSNYAQNSFESIASLLNKQDYNTSFYHGGYKGTMGFYSFCKKAGFSDYFGLEEYDNNNDFDNSWGIYDKPFFQYFAKNVNTKGEPFFSTFFSLSSHPPYTLPDNYLKDFGEVSKIGIRETILYSDFSMKNFFNIIKTKKWFNNTIFIITADHTSAENFNIRYNNKIGRYSIPLIIYSPDSSFIGINGNVVQQIDIMPTVLEIIGYNKPFFSFGKSMLSEKNWAINFIQNEYCLIKENSIILNKIEKYNSYKDWSLTDVNMINDDNIYLLKAIKQDYNFRMINNKIRYEN
jgi:phosphoglycerol transferase MdoB-like AlkP superfamily enzyme